MMKNAKTNDLLLNKEKNSLKINSKYRAINLLTKIAIALIFTPILKISIEGSIEWNNYG